MKKEELEIFRRIQSENGKKGGDTTYKKIGRKGMKALAEKRWKKHEGVQSKDKKVGRTDRTR